MNEDWNRDFKTKYEFKDAVSRGCDLCFEWKDIEYGIFPTIRGRFSDYAVVS